MTVGKSVIYKLAELGGLLAASGGPSILVPATGEKRGFNNSNITALPFNNLADRYSHLVAKLAFLLPIYQFMRK